MPEKIKGALRETVVISLRSWRGRGGAANFFGTFGESSEK